jgi:hypothetical protein
MKLNGHITAQFSLLTDKGRGYTLDIDAASSRTTIIRSSVPQLKHYIDWLRTTGVLTRKLSYIKYGFIE